MVKYLARLGNQNKIGRSRYNFKSVMPRDERGRWVGLPRTPARHFQARNRLSAAKNKPSTIIVRGLCFGSNGHGCFRAYIYAAEGQHRTDTGPPLPVFESGVNRID